MNKVFEIDIPLMVSTGELSVNKLYITRRGGKGRALSKIGEAWTRRTVFAMSQLLGPSAQGLDPNLPYYLELTFHIRVFTKGYPKKATNRFRIIDVGNLGKLVQDCVKEATFVDDSAHFDFFQRKRDCVGDPFVHVELWRMEDAEVFEQP